MMDQTSGRTLALGTADADGLAMELAQEQIGLRGDLNPFGIEILQRDAWGLDDDIILIDGFQIAFSEMFHSF